MQNVCAILVLIFLVCLSACKDPYLPELKPGQSNFLVVEGIISPGDNATQIRLSRTVPLNDSVPLKPERGATVMIEGEDATSYPLVEGSAGEYVALRLTLDLSKKYRLKIQTVTGGAYVSEYMLLKQTPAVSLQWARSSSGVQITLSSQDPQNNTRYYKWDYEETWEIRSKYDATYKYINGDMQIRDTAEQRMMKICWARTRPGNIHLVSTRALARDVIDKEPVVFIPQNDERLDARYSILVRLQALDKQGYEFFNLMKKNTESLGTLFDPQPFEITGNVRCLSNPEEKVIGYIMGSVPQEHRIFIHENELPGWEYRPGCITTEVPNEPEALKTFQDDRIIPYASIGTTPMPIVGYFGVSSMCADCRSRGNNERPSFW